MKHGDFTELAKAYVHRPGYSLPVLRMILNDILQRKKLEVHSVAVAEVGAGTGKLTENLLELGLSTISVEPNDSMREEGMNYVNRPDRVTWKKGSGEDTGLASNSADWVIMGSSFHWVDFDKGVKEFDRILKPGGVFTAIWNPRNIKASPLHSGIEQKIKEIVPGLNRVSSGSASFTDQLVAKLKGCKLFSHVLFLEEEYEISMSKERYMGAWHSTNDIQVQAGPEKWKQILAMIENEIKPLKEVAVPYKSRAWTAIKQG